MEKPLSLSEKIYILGIHPSKGGIIRNAASALNYALIGGVILELQKNGNIELENKRFVVKNLNSNDPVHRLALSKIRSISKSRRISSLVNRFSFSAREIRHKIRASLVEKGMIRLVERRFLLIFRWNIPVITDRKTVSRLLDYVERQTFSRSAEYEDNLLLSLIIPANLLRRIFPERHKRRLARVKLKNITAGNPVAKAIQQAIWAAHAAAAAAV